MDILEYSWIVSKFMQIYNMLLMHYYDDHFTPTSRKTRANINDNEEV